LKQNISSPTNVISYLTPDEFIFYFSNPFFQQAEILTRELIEHLSFYLSKRISKLFEMKQGGKFQIFQIFQSLS